MSDDEKGAGLEILWMDEGDKFVVEHWFDGERVITEEDIMFWKA